MQAQPSADVSQTDFTKSISFLRGRWKWLWVPAGLCIAGLAVMVFASGMVGCFYRRTSQTEVVNNARQISMALFEFKEEYGALPGESTAAAVRDATESELSFGNKTSNDFLRQLVAAGVAQSESMFHADIAGVHNPDGVMTPGDALSRGECGFSYIVPPAAFKGRRPLLVTPLVPGKDVFDPKPFDGKAVVIWSDASMVVMPVDKNGHVIVDGRNLMDPHHPVWDGQPPVIAWPDL